MRNKIPELTLACAGRFGDQHALMCTLHLEHIDHLADMIARLDTRIDEATLPFVRQTALLATIPGIGERAAQVIISEIGVEMTRFPTAAHLASWAGLCPGNNESAGQTTLRQAPPRQPGAAARPRGSCLGGRPPPGLPQISLPPARQGRGRLPQPGRREESRSSSSRTRCS